MSTFTPASKIGLPGLHHRRDDEPRPEPPKKPKPSYLTEVQELRNKKEQSANQSLLRLAVTIGSGKRVPPDTIQYILTSAEASDDELDSLVRDYNSWIGEQDFAKQVPEAERRELEAHAKLKAARQRCESLRAELEEAEADFKTAFNAAKSVAKSVRLFEDMCRGLTDNQAFQQFVGIEPLDVPAADANS